jgi:hypothetical protein
MYSQCEDSVSAALRGARVWCDAQKGGAGERATIGAHLAAGAVGWTQSANGQHSWPASPRACPVRHRGAPHRGTHATTLPIAKWMPCAGRQSVLSQGRRWRAECGRNAASCGSNCTVESHHRHESRRAPRGAACGPLPAGLCIGHSLTSGLGTLLRRLIRRRFSRRRAAAQSRPRGAARGSASPPAGRRGRSARPRTRRGRCARPPGRPSAR